MVAVLYVLRGGLPQAFASPASSQNTEAFGTDKKAEGSTQAVTGKGRGGEGTGWSRRRTHVRGVGRKEKDANGDERGGGNWAEMLPGSSREAPRGERRRPERAPVTRLNTAVTDHN